MAEVEEPSIQDIIAGASQKPNYPGADKLFAWLRNHGHVVTLKQVKHFTNRQAVRQIFHQPVKTPKDKQGKIVSTSLNERWTADLIDFTAQPSGDGKMSAGGSSASTDPPSFRYILIMQNVFSRERCNSFEMQGS